MENENADRFKNIMGICIAIVALVTALAAWRAAVNARAASAEDYSAVVAVLNSQETLALNFATAYTHLNAFTQFAIHDELLTQLFNAPAENLSDTQRALLDAQMNESDKLAATNRNFFPARYANKDGTYDLKREVAEQFAQAERHQTLVPDAHLARAAVLDNKTFAFIQAIILFSIALFLFTLAGAIHAQRRVLRWSGAALGIVLLLVGIAQIALTEFS